MLLEGSWGWGKWSKVRSIWVEGGVKIVGGGEAVSTPKVTDHHQHCLLSPQIAGPSTKPNVIGQYHLPQCPTSFLLPSPSCFCLFLFVLLFISQNLKAFGCRERSRAA